MELVCNFLNALDSFIVAVRKVRFKYRHQGINHHGERFAVLGLTVFKVLDRAQRFLAHVSQILEFRLQGIDFGLQGLVLRGKRLHFFAAHFDKFGMAFLFSLMERFFASRFSLDRLNLATDTFNRFLRLRNNARKAQAKEYLGQ